MSRRDHVALSERFGALLAVRLAMAALALLACVLAPGLVGTSAGSLAPVTVAYVGLALATELTRRVRGIRGLALGNRLLLVDGVWVALVLARTGSSRSLLGFLVYLHVIAVTLLLSYRTGLKVALWHGLLLFVTHYALVAGLIAPDSPIPVLRVARTTSSQASAFGAASFWLVAMATAGFSSLNERELRRSRAELRALADMGARIDDVRDPAAIADLLVAEVVATFGFGRGAVLGPDAVDETLRRSWERRRPVLVAAPRPAADPALCAALPGATNVVVAPLIADGEPLGALVLERGGKAGARMAGRTVEMVAQFAIHGALAIRNAALLAEVQRLAAFDGLTGLLNRREFEAALSRELGRSARTGEPCSLVVLDVDHFKSINDAHGHQAGDEVLRQVGRALRATSRTQDLPARYGGEEFVVILPACGGSEAAEVADRLRAAVAAAPGTVPVTMSAGVAAFPVNALDAEGLLRAADDALYESKRTGRNRTTRSRVEAAPPTFVGSTGPVPVELTNLPV